MQMAKLGMVSFFILTARVAQAQKFVRRGCPAPVKAKTPVAECDVYGGGKSQARNDPHRDPN